jgi:ribokinase
MAASTGTSRPIVVVAGGINLDYVVRTPRLPRPGETVRGGDVTLVPGGKGANQAAAVARAGGDARLLGLVGDDAAGEQSLASVTADGIDTNWVRRLTGVPSGIALIAVAAGGENTIIVAPGANAHASAAYIESCTGAFAGVRAILLQFEWPLDAVRACLAAAPAGALRILNAAPVQREGLDLIANVDWLLVNEVEAEVLSGVTVDGVAGARQAASVLRKLGAPNVVVTLGGDGAILEGQQCAGHQPAPRVDVIDSTAAGDSFAGALAVALASGQSAPAALRRAATAGSLACTVLGARTSIPTSAAVDTALAATPAFRAF